VIGSTYPCSVVVVDGDHRARRALVAGLTGLGYGVSDAATGIAGVERALTEACDAVVVAVPLPDMSHTQFITMISAVGDLPVIAMDRDRVGVGTLLIAGAADATSGAPDVDEIDARVRSALERAGGVGPEGAVIIGDLRIDPASREAMIGERELDLSRKEFDLLLTLARRAGTVVSKQELLADVWHRSGNDKTVDVHLSWLRRKMGESASEPNYLRTVRGVGVKLVHPAG